MEGSNVIMTAALERLEQSVQFRLGKFLCISIDVIYVMRDSPNLPSWSTDRQTHTPLLTCSLALMEAALCIRIVKCSTLHSLPPSSLFLSLLPL